MNDISTREKILKTSHKLFAEKGIKGVSVREIAKECDVNIAAINYHFSNKESLYLATIKHGIFEMREDLKGIFNSLKKKDVLVMALTSFKHFIDKKEDLSTCFKVMLNSEGVLQADLDEEFTGFHGPPGGEYFYECLLSEHPKIAKKDLEWGVRVIFTQILHKALIFYNCSIKDSLERQGMDEKLFRSDIKRLVKAVKSELK